MFQQRGYIKVQIGQDRDNLLDQLINECSIDFAEWSDEGTNQTGVEVCIRVFAFECRCNLFRLQIVCQTADLSKVTKVVEEYSPSSPLCEILTSEVNWAPLENQDASDEARARVDELVGDLEVDDDIERVFTTLEQNSLIIVT